MENCARRGNLQTPRALGAGWGQDWTNFTSTDFLCGYFGGHGGGEGHPLMDCGGKNERTTKPFGIPTPGRGQMKATGSMNYPGDKAQRQEYGSHTGHRGEPGVSGAAGRGEARRAGPGGGGPARGGAGPHFLSPGGVGAAVGPWPGARSRVPPRRWSGS